MNGEENAMRAKRTLLAVNALLVAILACNLPAGQNPAQSPNLAGTITAQALLLMESSNTPVLTSTPPFTEVPSLTPAPSLSPTPATPQVTVTSATNCRTGPGAVYDLLDTLQPGQTAEVVGKDTPDNYWIIKMPGSGTCWLWGQYASVSGNVAGLPEIPPPPTPTPSLPANPSSLKVAFHCALSVNPSPHNDVHADISWQDNATNEDGYYVFRDGTLLAALAANTSSFSDDTSMAALILPGNPKPQITYSVQAFNSAGKSKKISKSISCF
jgi:hypothetical protein